MATPIRKCTQAVRFVHAKGNLFHYGHFIVDAVLPLARYYLEMEADYDAITFLLEDCKGNQFGGMEPKLLDMFPKLRLSYVDSPHLKCHEIQGYQFGPYPEEAFQPLDTLVGTPSTCTPDFQDLVVCIERGYQPISLDSKFVTNREKTGRNRRFLKNHDHVVARLQTWSISKKLTFRNVVLEEMPWKEQQDLFQRARVVFGQHGAGMCNVVFCIPHSRTVVLETSHWGLPTIQNLARAKGLKHRMVLGDSHWCDLTSLEKALSKIA